MYVYLYHPGFCAFFKLMCIYSYVHIHHVHLILYQVTCTSISGYIKHKLFPFLGGEQSELGWRGVTFKQWSMLL
jgi:hypothetical protein